MLNKYLFLDIVGESVFDLEVFAIDIISARSEAKKIARPECYLELIEVVIND